MICTRVVMSEDKCEKLKKDEKRPVLGDITNQQHQQLGKRPFSLISSTSSGGGGNGGGGPTSSTSSSGNDKKNKTTASDTSFEEKDALFWNQVALIVENLEKERSKKPKCPKLSNEPAGLSPLKGGKIYRLQGSNAGPETKEPSTSALDNIVIGDGDGDGNGDGEGEGKGEAEGEDEALRNVATASDAIAAGESSKSGEGKDVEAGKMDEGEETRDLYDVAEIECTQLQPTLAAKAGSSRLVDSHQDKRSFGLERCGGLKGNSCSNMSASLDSLKSCSCSFCTTAAYIWSDLHYQDVKGRISVLMKSQKEASDLGQMYSGENEMGGHNQGNSSKAIHVEADLSTQWKSLFSHMESIFACESSQLQENFAALKELRDEFKTNLDGSPTDVHPCSSDASDHRII